MTTDKFQIGPMFKFMLVFRAIIPIFIVGVLIWAVTSPSLKFTEWGPIIFVGIIAWAIWEIVKLVRWIGFYIELSDQGIIISGTQLAWSDIISASAKTAYQFQTFIELTTKDDRVFKIPACVQESSFVLTKIEKHIPGLVRED